MIPNEINETKDQVKHLLFYQVENLKDDYEDLEEKYYDLNLDFKEKNRLLEFLIRDFKKLAEEMKCLNLYVNNRKVELKNKLKDQKEENTMNGFGNYNYDQNGVYNFDSSGIEQLKNENELSSLETERNDLLTSFQNKFQNLANEYVQSLIDYKATKLDDFKQDVLKIESTNDGLNLISLVNSLNGDNLNLKIKNFVNYKRKLEEHLNKLRMQLKEERQRTEQFSERSPIDLNNLNKLNLEKLNLNKTDDSDEDKNSNKNILELRFALLRAQENLDKLRKVQLNLEKEIYRYSNEKETVEARIDLLKNNERKLLRELKDTDSRIKELQIETIHNQKMIEQLKK